MYLTLPKAFFGAVCSSQQRKVSCLLLEKKISVLICQGTLFCKMVFILLEALQQAAYKWLREISGRGIYFLFKGSHALVETDCI